MTGVTAVPPFGSDSPGAVGGGSDGAGARATDAEGVVNPVFEELKRETERVDYDELVGELEAEVAEVRTAYERLRGAFAGTGE